MASVQPWEAEATERGEVAERDVATERDEADRGILAARERFIAYLCSDPIGSGDPQGHVGLTGSRKSAKVVAMGNVIRANRVYRFLSILVGAVIISSIAVDLFQASVDPSAWAAFAASAALIAYAAHRLKAFEDHPSVEGQALPQEDWNRPLTDRQKVFVAGILAGKSAKEIAAGEGVKPATVYNALTEPRRR